MDTKQFLCRWCGQPAEAHEAPGGALFVSKQSRRCLKDGKPLPSQFFTPMIQLHLRAVRDDLLRIRNDADSALARMKEMLE